MKKNTFQFFPALILVLGIGLLALIWYQSSSLEDVYLQRIRQELLIRSNLMKSGIGRLLSDNAAGLQKFCKDSGKANDTRITVIAPDGKVLADSEENPEKMADHAGRPEVVAALGGESETTLRYSATLATRMIYAAQPLSVNGKRYIIRTAVSIKSIDDVINQARRDILIFGLLVALITGVLSYSIVRGVSRPIENLKESAAGIAAGNLDLKLPIPSRGAIRDLALSLNNMAEQLKERLSQVSMEKQKRDAVFSGMSEGVIAIDRQGVIVDRNRVAAEILQLPEDAVGSSIYGVESNVEMQSFMRQLLDSDAPMETELVLHVGHVRYIKVRGALLLEDGVKVGAVVVLFDVTRIKKLENFRRDFIADVSHEIKTPLTAIRGAVEALEGGALHEAAAAARFMHIITRHSERLDNLVHDILSLSSLERRTWNGEREFALVDLAAPVSSAIDLSRHRAESRNVALHCDKLSSGKWIVQGDMQLLEQAVTNLIDNALKYGGDGIKVKVALERDNDDVLIKVSDNGIGIVSTHLPRLFERFYRVDRARSRKLGGTGLGLAIVKHIAQLHKGSVSVDSESGHGSTFTIRLPLAEV